MAATQVTPPSSLMRSRKSQATPGLSRFATWASLALAGAGVAVILLTPASGTDLATQQFRAAFAAAYPGHVVDLGWFGGTQGPAYSVLSPYLMAVLGVRLTGAIAVVISAVLFPLLLRRWSAPRVFWASVWGAVVFVLDLTDGRVTFAAGVAVGLASLVLVPPSADQHRGSHWPRWVPAVVLAVLCPLVSPVAALFLALTAFGWAICRRSLAVVIVATLAPLGVIAALFPETGSQPDAWSTLRPDLIATAAVLLLCRPWKVRAVAFVYGVALLVIYLHPNPVGSNIERYASLFVGPALICCWRLPRVLLLLAMAVVGYWNTEVPIRDLHAAQARQVEVDASHRLIGILNGVTAAQGPLTGRVEVVPFRDHAESEIVPSSYPLARGWERQLDTKRAATLYDGTLTAARFRAWLDANSVEYVALGHHAHDFGGAHEVKLLAHPPSYLQPVHVDPEWTVWRVRDSRPIVGAPGQLVAMTPASLSLSVSGPATVPLDVHWTRWWHASGGASVVKRGDELSIRVPRAETVTLSSSY